MKVGNEKLRELARKVAEKYHRSSKKEKSYLSRSLVQQVLEMDPPGRFLRRHPKDNYWEDMSHDDDKCREKCAQVLRDAVAYVGLKEPPKSLLSKQADQDQRQQVSPFPAGRNGFPVHPNQQYAMSYNPFVRSAATSSSIMRHHLLASGNRQPLPGHFAFPDFNPPMGRKHPYAPGGNGYSVAAAYAQMPSTTSSIPSGTESAAKRRCFSNYFDQFGNTQQLDPGVYGYTSGLGYEQSQPHTSNPGSSTPRRDSFLGNLSITAGSDHSGPTMKDFELFPDITVNVDAGMQPPSKNDGDEFSSEFY